MEYYMDDWFSEPIVASSERAIADDTLGECSADLTINHPLEWIMGNIWATRDFFTVKERIAQTMADQMNPHPMGGLHRVIQWETRRAEASALRAAIHREHPDWNLHDDDRWSQ